MSKFGYLMVWAIGNMLIINILEYFTSTEILTVCIIFFVGNLSGMMCEYIGNDLKILNQDRK